MNASMARTSLRRWLNADFRLDSTNALNTVVYPSWNTNIKAPSSGCPHRGQAMRIVQANMRVRIP